MNKSLLLVMFSSLTSMPAFSATINHFRYLDVAYFETDVNSPDEPDGLELKVSYDIGDYVYLSGTYQDWNYSFTDITRWLAALGGKYQINEQFIPYAQVEYVEFRGGALNSSISYRIYSMGFAGTISDFGYKAALTRYNSSDFPDENGYYAELFYSLNKNISLGLKTEHANNDGGDVRSLTFRYHY